MKKIGCLLLLITQIFWAQNGFDQGNAFYQKEQYSEAAQAYEQVVASGKQSADLYFNLGNSYYKMNKVAPSIYNYEKALLLRPNDKDVLTNLNFAQKMTIDQIKEVPKVGFEKLLRDFTAAYHYDTWAWITIWLSVFFLLCFMGYYFARLTVFKRIFFVAMFVMIVAGMISLTAAIFERSYYENERPAIVFAESAQVKSEPRTTASDVFVLHEGTKVMVLEKTASWYKIELLDGSDGWIESNAIKEVK